MGIAVAGEGGSPHRIATLMLAQATRDMRTASFCRLRLVLLTRETVFGRPQRAQSLL
jgi:hypothetical protein